MPPSKKMNTTSSASDLNSQSQLAGLTYSQIQKLIENAAWQDRSFKEKVIRNPKAALKSKFGICFDAATQLSVTDCSDKNAVYFTIPPNPAELSAEDLAAMAGGTDLSSVLNAAMTGYSTTPKNCWVPLGME